MDFVNLLFVYKIGIIMAFIPLIAAILDFIIFCKAGANTGEGCGFLLIVISLPLITPIQIISFPVTFLFNSLGLSSMPGAFHITYTPALMAVYFLIGLLIGKIIIRIKKNKE